MKFQLVFYPGQDPPPAALNSMEADPFSYGEPSNSTFTPSLEPPTVLEEWEFRPVL